MMTREEIDRHVVGILRLRKLRNYQRGRRIVTDRGFNTPQDFRSERRTVAVVSARNVTAEVGAVDQVFSARQRAGWLPRGGGRD